MTVKLRLATPTDAPACAAIVNDWIDAKDWLPRLHSNAAIEEMIRTAIPMREVWIAGDPVQGYLSFDVEAGKIMGLYTRVPGRGVGKALVDHVKNGRTSVLLWSHAANTRAHAFYRREGFVETGRNESGGDGIPEIRMEWRRSDGAGLATG